MTLVLSGIIENDKRNPKGIAMPDIALRLNKDMLVLSAPLDARLQDQGFDIEKDAAYSPEMELIYRDYNEEVRK